MARQPGRPPIDLGAKIRASLSHTVGPSPIALCPILEYQEAVNADFRLTRYFEGHLDRRPHYAAVRSRHMDLLRRFVLADLIQTFERFVKGLAAVCVDQLGAFVVDDRFDTFSASGDEIIAHFSEGSIGKALCESDTWLSNKKINERFRRILRSPDGSEWDEFPFPGKNQKPGYVRDRASTLAVLWQIRHTLAHNAGLVTGSDAMKLRTLAGRPVDQDRVLAPDSDDLRFVKRFLTEMADDLNRRVGERLAVILTKIREDSPTLFESQEMADRLAGLFQRPLSVGNASASP